MASRTNFMKNFLRGRSGFFILLFKALKDSSLKVSKIFPLFTKLSYRSVRTSFSFFQKERGRTRKGLLRLRRFKISFSFQKEKGMTLIEMLLSLGIFAFMFIFIAQIMKQNYRQVNKMSKDSRSSHSQSHILDIMRQDFRGVSYLLDVNHNLYAKFPIEEVEDSQTQKVFHQKSKYKKNSAFL